MSEKSKPTIKIPHDQLSRLKQLQELQEKNKDGGDKKK